MSAPTVAGTARWTVEQSDVDLDVNATADHFRARIAGRELDAPDLRTLRALLGAAIYDVWHAGRRDPAELGRIVREPSTEDVLATALTGRTNVRRGVLRSWSGSEAVVELPEATFRVPRRHLVEGQHPTVGSRIDLVVPAARPGLSHGFLMVDGSADPATAGRPGRGIRRCYLHVRDVDSAARLWRRALELLDATGTAHRSKALSHRDGYPRTDAVVLYLGTENALGVATELATVLGDDPGLAPETSVFAHRVAPGIAVADEPADGRPGRGRMSFGEHRAHAVAAGLLAHATGEAVDRVDAIRTEFTAAGIDPANPAYNLHENQPGQEKT